MGSQQSSHSKKSSSCLSTSSSPQSLSTLPEKHGNKRNLSAEDVLSRGKSMINLLRATTRRMNEIMYAVYKKFNASNLLLSRSRSLSEDLLFFYSQLEQLVNIVIESSGPTHDNDLDHHNNNNNNHSEDLRADQVMSLVDALDLLVRTASKTYRDSADQIMQSVQLIEHIETVESRDKKQINAKNLKNQLDAVQFDLNEASQAFETFILSKFPTNPIDLLSNLNNKLQGLKQRLFVPNALAAGVVAAAAAAGTNSQRSNQIIDNNSETEIEVIKLSRFDIPSELDQN